MFENLPSKSKKKDSDKVLTRLILILQKLSNNELPTRKELMEEFNVSAKTIQRDLNERLIYFPIEETLLKQLKFIDGFSLKKSSLSEDEMLFVYLSLSQIKDINKSFEKKTFEIFSKLLSPTFSSPYYIKPKSFENIDMDSKLLNDIERAIEYKNRLELILNNTRVNIEPYRVVSFDGIWYLFGKELENEKIKTYFIHQIQKINILKEKYFLEKPIHEILDNVHSAWFEDGNQFDVEVKVNSCVAYNFKLKEVLPSQEILKEYENGDLLIKFKVSTEEDVDNIIKAWIPDVKIVSPKCYKEKFVNELEDYIRNYSIS